MQFRKLAQQRQRRQIGFVGILKGQAQQRISDRLDGIEAFANIILERVDAARQAQVVAS